MALRRRKKESAEEDFQMAPMIDMVFLLLVFFMCVSTMAQAEKKKLDLPQSDEAEVAEDLADRAIVSVDAEGKAYVGASEVSLAQLKERLEFLLQENPKTRVQVRADKATTYEHIKQVLKTCAESGVYEIIYASHQSS